MVNGVLADLSMRCAFLKSKPLLETREWVAVSDDPLSIPLSAPGDSGSFFVTKNVDGNGERKVVGQMLGGGLEVPPRAKPPIQQARS
jgi:hypothetical protein